MSEVKPVPDSGPMFKLTPDSERILRLERAVTRLTRLLEGKGGIRRKAPQLIGLYPAKAGGVEVYLRGVGSGVKDRSAYRVGIARDERTAKDAQTNVLLAIVRTLRDPDWAKELALYWEAKGYVLTPPANPPQTPAILPAEENP